MAYSPESPARALATLSGLPATLRAGTECHSVPSAAGHGAGAHSAIRTAVSSPAAASPVAPSRCHARCFRLATRQHRRANAPHAERLTRQAVCLLPGIQQTNGFTCTAAIPIAGEPPETRFPWTVSFKVPATVPPLRSGPAVLTFKPTANPSPIADMKNAGGIFRASPAIASCSALRPTGRFRRPSNFLLGAKNRSTCGSRKAKRPAGLATAGRL
jgi:hypothetical protein